VVPFVKAALADHATRLKMAPIKQVDVIFVLSASETHDLSTADPASQEDWLQDLKGEKFSFSIDPYCQKEEEILKNDCECKLCQSLPKEEPEPINSFCEHSTHLKRIDGPDRLLTHEYCPSPTLMGRVAMNALDVRVKLPIHEFAHAMSSHKNGLIVDEYYDYSLVKEKDAAETNQPRLPSECPNKPQDENDPEYPNVGILVNRIYRNPALMRRSHKVKVHNVFSRYNGYVYESDRQHHSDRQGWYSYFPERRQREVLCTMDAAHDVFEFDELIRDFMYDRLWAKVNRDFLAGTEPICPE
jgi:hypothetical protein